MSAFRINVFTVEVDQEEGRLLPEFSLCFISFKEFAVDLGERIGLSTAGITEDSDVAGKQSVHTDPNFLALLEG